MLKKIAAAAAPFAYLAFSAASALAQPAGGTSIGVQVGQPAVGINPFTSISTLLSNALTIVFVVAALAVLFFLVIGAFRWITSGGEKEAIGKARGTIVNALIGLAILALAFLIVVVVGQLLNINILNIRAIPSLDACSLRPGTKFDPTSGGCIPINAPPAIGPGTVRP